MSAAIYKLQRDNEVLINALKKGIEVLEQRDSDDFLLKIFSKALAHK